jgi:hypothetical protein
VALVGALVAAWMLGTPMRAERSTAVPAKLATELA